MKKRSLPGKVIVDGLDFTGQPGLLRKYRLEKASRKKCCGGKTNITRKYSNMLSRGR
jgi:hypothetical protein